MGIRDDLKRAWTNLLNMDDWFAGSGRHERVEHIAKQRDYYNGDQDRQIVVKPNQRDYNMVVNFTGLIVERGVSMLLGGGVEFDMPGADTKVDPATGKKTEVNPVQDFIDEVWDANKKDILLHKTAQFGGVNGTPYIKLQPEGVESRMRENVMLTRIIPLDPLYMRG